MTSSPFKIIVLLFPRFSLLIYISSMIDSATSLETMGIFVSFLIKIDLCFSPFLFSSFPFLLIMTARRIKMKKILFISIIAILLANSIMAEGSKESAVSGDQLERIKAKGEIIIAMEGTWAPWTYHNEKDELVGYDTEIGKAIADKLGVKAVFIEGDWDGLLAGLDAGRYDIMIHGVD